MALVKKRIKGRYYWYLQHSRRVNGKVKTTSHYVAAVAAPIKVAVIVATRGIPTPKEQGSAIKVEPTINGFNFRTDWDAVKEFEHESGIKSAHHEGASSSQLSSDEG